MSLLSSANISVHAIYAFVFRYTRPRRMRLFAGTFPRALRTNGHILDVGGYPLNWTYINHASRIVLVNLSFSETRAPGFHYVIADGRRLPFRDGAFDVAYSNSVIEHVGSREDQALFAGEISRVGRGYFVQTPNRWFPIEPHLLCPLIHYLPATWQRRLIRRFTIWGLLERPTPGAIDSFLTTTRLVTHRELGSLFSDGRVVREKVGGLTKSLIAVRESAAGLPNALSFSGADTAQARGAAIAPPFAQPELGPVVSPSRLSGIVGVAVSPVDPGLAASIISYWIRRRERRYVCITGVQGIMESQADPELLRIHSEAGLVAPDGMPLVVVGRLMGDRKTNRAYGPDLMLEIFRRSVAGGYSHFLYGATEATLSRLGGNLKARFPGTKIAGTYAPPSRPLNKSERAEVIERINQSGADIVWV